MSFRGSIDDERGGLLAELTAGFEALMEKADELVLANSQLSDNIQALHTEIQRQYTPNQTSLASSTNDLRECPRKIEADWRRDPVVNKGIQAWKLLKIVTLPAIPLRNGFHSPSKVEINNSKNGSVPPATPLERDFTTEGPKGDLKCPFSGRGSTICGNKYKVPDPNVFAARTDPTERNAPSPDPIAREFHEEVKKEAPPKSENAAAPKCPIRFIDQHTPEEVAKYVENHKHEIPRSHEVCVRRYQANEASIRKLDSKYGSLVKMIQGLGEKHKPMLPAGQEADGEAAADPSFNTKSINNIEKWANDLPDGELPDTLLDTQSQPAHEERTGHFERPLEEVRLGESPSRPWGIRVPDTVAADARSETGHAQAASRRSSIALPTNAPLHEAEVPMPTPKGKCPFGHGGPPAVPEHKPVEPRERGRPVPVSSGKEIFDEALRASKDGRGASRIVFTGPVFFGYSAEDAAALMGMIPGMGNCALPD